MNINIELARNFAIKEHGVQLYGNYPYSYHLDEVYQLICDAGLCDDFKIGAYLHDLLEDTTVTKNDIEEKFNSNIALMVFCVSGFGKNRKEKHVDIIDKLSQYPQYIDLKMADRIVNMRNCLLNNNEKLFLMYTKEMNLYKDLFIYGNPFYKKIFLQEFNYNLDISQAKTLAFK